MTPIPPHLARLSWYAPHLAWLRSIAIDTEHDPGEAQARRANLSYADIIGANLRGAILSDAILSGAILSDAILSDANLSGAILSNANLRDANLSGANLSGAILGGADLSCATMPDGRTWEDYRADPLAGICDEPEARERAVSAWGHHRWGHCPMSAAHGYEGHHNVPQDKALLVGCFVATFDAHLLPDPRTT